MGKRIVIKASDVAACVGLNPYKPAQEVRDELWKKHWPETFTGRTKRDVAEEALGRSSTSRKLLAEALAFRAENSEAAQSNFTQIKDKIEADASISAADKQTLVEHLRSKCYTTHGTRSEDKTSTKLTEETGAVLVKDNAFYNLTLLEMDDVTFVITGKVDRIEVGPDGSRTLVEIKNRTRGLFKSLREYENVQIQVYLQMLGLVHAKLVEQYNNSINTIAVDRDEELWVNVLEPGLKSFALDLFNRATN
jgi:RecB family exonuclease